MTSKPFSPASIIAAVAVLTSLLSFPLTFIAADSPNRSQKKLIEFGWDEPDTAFMKAHITEMERSPFDGCVFRVAYRKPDGQPGRFTWECWGTHAFTQAELAPALADLKATQFRRFTHNFLRFNTTPAKLDWFDDFTAILQNASLAATLAREGQCKGILFDVEQYEGRLFDYRQQRDAATKSYEDYAAQVRRRGQEVMQAFQTGFPDLTIFLTFGYSLPLTQTNDGKRPLADCPDGLLVPFLDGMVDAASGKTRMVDGYELSYGYKDPDRFTVAYKRMREDVLPIVSNPSKYRDIFSFGFGIWMDYDWRKIPWSTNDLSANYFSPAALETSVRRALQVADDCVWIYTETPRWWSAQGTTIKLPPEYDAALRRARLAP